MVRAARAKGIERPWAIDATAGFGEDSLLLAAVGFTVDLYEQDCVIAALLKDALDRAADEPALATAVARMRLHAGEDSIAGLRHTAELIGQGELTAPDVVYIWTHVSRAHQERGGEKEVPTLASFGTAVRR